MHALPQHGTRTVHALLSLLQQTRRAGIAVPPPREKCAVQGAQVVKCAERNNRDIRPNPDPVREIFRDKRESDPKTNPENEQSGRLKPQI